MVTSPSHQVKRKALRNKEKGMKNRYRVRIKDDNRIFVVTVEASTFGEAESLLWSSEHKILSIKLIETKTP